MSGDINLSVLHQSRCVCVCVCDWSFQSLILAFLNIVIVQLYRSDHECSVLVFGPSILAMITRDGPVWRELLSSLKTQVSIIPCPIPLAAVIVIPIIN